MDCRILADEFGVDGVHQKRHVVRDDVHDAAVRLVHDPDAGRARDADSGNFAVGLGAGSQDVRRIRPGILLRKVLVIVSEVPFTGSEQNGLILHIGARRHRQTPPSQVHGCLIAALMASLAL